MALEDQNVIVIKLNTHREETWRYDGRIVARDESGVLIEAFFNRDDLPFHGITLQSNDRFLERYFKDRWYNIFEIHDRTDNRIKGWYCNITKPAEITPGKVAYVDLALDLLVYPNGDYLILDEEEFQQLGLNDGERENAERALEALIQCVIEDKLPNLVA